MEANSFNLTPKNRLSGQEKERLAKLNYKLIHYYVRKYNNRSYDYNDLFGAGQLGMVKALNNFDPTKGIKFATYAARCIANEIFAVYRKEDKHMSNVSIDTPIKDGKDGNEVSILDTLVAPDNDLDDLSEALPAVQKVFQKLNERERNVIQLFIENKKQKEIASELGITPGYVSRIVKRVFESIKYEYKRMVKEDDK